MHSFIKKTSSLLKGFFYIYTKRFNMYNSIKLIASIRNEIGWENHYNDDIADLTASLNITDTGEFYHNYHPLATMTYVNAIKPDDQDLSQYLTKLEDGAIVKMINDIILKKREFKSTKDILTDGELIDKVGWTTDKIVGENRFVGFQIQLRNEIGIAAVIKRIALQIDANQTLDMYLFHTSKSTQVDLFQLAYDKTPSIQWLAKEISMVARDETLSGGIFYLGYYEEDLTGQAINRRGYKWLNGSCSTCGSTRQRVQDWSKINNSFKILPIHVKNYGVKGEMFLEENVVVDLVHTWGLNISLGIKCDYTQFFIDNKRGMKNLLGLSVIHALIMDAKYSPNLNFIKQNADYHIIQELGGVKDSNYISIVEQRERELEAITYDQSNLSSLCLGVDNRNRVKYRQA